ncbi:hypothetical protein MRX96_059613 [Rhipicephalus microplus]
MDDERRILILMTDHWNLHSIVYYYSSTQQEELPRSRSFDPPILKPHVALALGKNDARAREVAPGADGAPKAALPQDHDHHRLLQRAPAPEAAPRPAPGAARPTDQDPTPPSGVKGKSYLTWADRARGNQEQASNSQDSHDPRLTNELKELRRANDSLRKENAQFKQEISRLATEIAEIRKLALKPPAPPAATSSSAMDTAEAPPKAGAVKRRALDSSREDETLELLSELKKAISNIQSGLSQVQEMIAHPQLGLVALSERILRLEGTHHGFLPSTSTTPVPNLNSVIAPPTEGAILQAALSKPMPKPKHG